MLETITPFFQNKQETPLSPKESTSPFQQQNWKPLNWLLHFSLKYPGFKAKEIPKTRI